MQLTFRFWAMSTSWADEQPEMLEARNHGVFSHLLLSESSDRS
jgi:hypothetical protein